MRSHVYQERKRNRALLIIFIGALFGFIYPSLSNEFGDPYAFINGIIIGLCGGVFIAAFELYLNNPLNKKIGFIKKMITKSLSYTLFFMIQIPIVVAFTRSIETGTGYFDYLFGEEMRNFIFHDDYSIIVLYTLFLSSAIIFTHQLSRKLGQNVLWNFITGKYRFPKEEERIFMFLDLNNSTPIAEKLGDVEFNVLLNEIFFDLTNPILSTYGEIYRYVGDEIVVTWNMRKGLKNANCIRTFFQVKYTLRLLREKYMTKYGFLPSFSAGFHCGKVIVGEIGDVKSQITFLGDVLYNSAFIEKQCRKLEKEILASDTLIKRISLPEIYEMKLATSIKREEEERSMDLYTISEIDLANS
ncbi:MAG: adenylate/guanylate cyclase domain-containing protein [Saprospiraceae bacterium]|nr:adenylate/guanylate cyclase domain-containing protein [Saprospiraceae bacterium]